jgi:hypothetical protein
MSCPSIPDVTSLSFEILARSSGAQGYGLELTAGRLAGSSSFSLDRGDEREETGFRVLIIYYSQTGNTGRIARAIQRRMKPLVDQCDLVPVKKVPPSSTPSATRTSPD